MVGRVVHTRTRFCASLAVTTTYGILVSTRVYSCLVSPPFSSKLSPVSENRYARGAAECSSPLVCLTDHLPVLFAFGALDVCRIDENPTWASRRCWDARVLGYQTTAMHETSTRAPPGRSVSKGMSGQWFR